MTIPVQLPTRSKRFGIGKAIGGAVYVHRDYAGQLGEPVLRAGRSLPVEFEYQIVKYNLRTGAVSFICSPDFDTADEPTVGEIIIVASSGILRRRRLPRDPEIYHHKWLFVADDYLGFDVAASKARSHQWLALGDVDRQRIGRQSYWQREVLPRLSKTD